MRCEQRSEREYYLFRGDSEYVEFILQVRASHVFEFTVLEVGTWTSDGEPVDPEKYLEGIIKFDGCSHVYFGDEGYLHLCGVAYWKAHVELMEFIYKMAETKIDLQEDERWEG